MLFFANSVRLKAAQKTLESTPSDEVIPTYKAQ